MASRLPLLFLCHRIPYPPNKGDKIRAFHLLVHLSRHFDIYLASFVDDADDWAGAEELHKYCREVYLRPLNPTTAKIRSLTGLLSQQALSLPYYADSTLKQWVARACQSHNIRHALVYSSTMAQFLPDKGSNLERKVIDFVDIDSDKWRQYSEQKPWPLSWLYRREARLLLKCERELASTFDASLFVSSTEADLFRELAPESSHKIGFYNNGVDSDYFDPQSNIGPALENPFPAGCQALVFTGAMDYWPNVDAVIWFAEQAFPALRAKHPALEFYIVGGKPAASVQQLAALPGITVTGRVPDVRPYLKYAVAAVAPMRIARGIQNKVLEGMAMARPVLVSSKGLEGIDARHEEHILLADTAADYERCINAVLAGNYPALGEQARACVQQHFNWDNTLPEVVNLLQHACSPGSTGIPAAPSGVLA